MNTILLNVFFIVAGLGLIQQQCSGEPSRANIVPVKLYHLNYANNNSSSPFIVKDHFSHGTVAKISRVVPLKNIKKYKFKSDHFNDSIPLKIINSTSKGSSFKPKSKVRPRHLHKELSKLLPVPKSNASSTFKKLTNSSSVPETKDKSTLKNKEDRNVTTAATASPSKPPFFSDKSWKFVTSLIADYELNQILDSISDEIIQNITKLAEKDPILSENYILNNIVNVKQPRMFEIDDINTGVRFSAKMQPVLNVIPLQNQLENITLNHRKLSGYIQNENGNESDENIPTNNYFYEGEFNSGNGNAENIVADQSFMRPRKAPRSRIPPTTPKIFKVLSMPNIVKLETTTFIPPTPSSGFIPVNPAVHESQQSSTIQRIPVVNISSTEKPKLAAENSEIQQYQIPSITTSSTVEPEVIRGYQTIPEATTSGPKIVWYNHNQTPEDTFYPNSDIFLVPPEEQSIEIITDLSVDDFSTKSQQRPLKTSYADNSIEQDASSANYGDKDSESNTYTSITHSNSKEENGRGGRRSIKKDTHSASPRYPSSTKQRMRNVKNALLPSATIIENDDGKREIYEDEFRQHGGGSGKRQRQKYIVRQRESGRYRDRDVPNDDDDALRNHKPYSEDDAPSYVPFTVLEDHYHDTYPPPPPYANKPEIGSLHGNHRDYPSRPSNSNSNYYTREESESLRPAPYRGEISNELEFYGRPPSETELSKDSHPSHHHHGHGSNYHRHHDYHHHGHKDKGFMSLAKEYFKNSDFSTTEKWFGLSLGILAFVAFGFYIFCLLYQVYSVSSRSPLGSAFGKSFREAGEVFDSIFSKGPLGQAYIDELETIVKRAMVNVKRSWMTKNFAGSENPIKAKGDEGAKKKKK